MEKDGKKRKVVVKERKIARDEFMAATIGDTVWLDQSLRDGHNANLFDKQGLAPIHLAALHGRLNCIKMLVEKYNVDVNLESASGWRATHLTVNKGNEANALECLNYLIENGADVNAVNRENTTAVHQAAAEGLLDCLKTLLENGADSHIKDVRGQTAQDLAKLWGNKACARVVTDDNWKRKKSADVREKRKLDKLKEAYKELQKEALLQLQNEQDFYGNVNFNNWLEEKGIAVDPMLLSFLTENRRKSEVDGLINRLLHGGAVDDFASKVERLAQTKPKTSSAKGLKRSTPTKSAEKTRGASRKLNKYIDRSSEFGYGRRIQLRPTSTGYGGWNFSTNVESRPATDIKNVQTICISTKPDKEQFPVMPTTANLSVQLVEENNKVSIKVVHPGGTIADAGIPMPKLSPDIIRKTLYGTSSDRISIPEDFSCIHIFDVTHKSRPKVVQTTEVATHLKMFVDGYCFNCDCPSKIKEAHKLLPTYNPYEYIY